MVSLLPSGCLRLLDLPKFSSLMESALPKPQPGSLPGLSAIVFGFEVVIGHALVSPAEVLVGLIRSFIAQLLILQRCFLAL